MARNSPISIRLDPEVQQELEHMSRETGLPMSTLARMAIEAAIRAFRKKGGRLELPLHFEAVTYSQGTDRSERMVAEERE